MSFTKPTSSIILRVFFTPLLVLLLVQLPGCTKKPTLPPPPGGTYRSTSAGASFDQSVNVSGIEGGYITGYNLGIIHRVPNTPTTIYMSAGTAGIVFSTDDGQSWQRVATPLTNTVDALLLNNGTLVVAGVGGDKQGYILRSLDRGQTWETVQTIPVATKKGGLSFNIIGSQPVNSVITSLAINPFHPDQVYATTTLGSIFIGEQSAKVWRSLYTLDNSILINNQGGQVGLRALIPSPFNGRELLLLTTDNRLVRINDGKQERIRIPLDNEVAGIQTFDSGRKVLSAAYVAKQPNMLLIGTGDGALLSRDSGLTWTALDLPVETNTIFNSVVVAASPSNSNRLFVMINDVIYRSENGGKNWNTYSLELGQFIIHDFSINPTAPADVLLTMVQLKT